MKLVPKLPHSPYPPQGGYSFLDPRTGMSFDGLHGNVESTARKVVAHRVANPKLYPEGGGGLDETIQEIYAQKNATHPHLFLGGPELKLGQQPQAATVCACGSTEFVEILCKTCGSRVVTGRKCAKCGKKV